MQFKFGNENISPTFQQGQRDLGLTLSGTCLNKHTIHLSQVPTNAKEWKLK